MASALIGVFSLKMSIYVSFKHLPDNGNTEITASICMEVESKPLTFVSSIIFASFFVIFRLYLDAENFNKPLQKYFHKINTIL